MSTIFFGAAMAAILGVVVTLLGGLRVMAKGGAKARTDSNKMMRLRVVLQAAAVVFLALAYFSK